MYLAQFINGKKLIHPLFMHFLLGNYGYLMSTTQNIRGILININFLYSLFMKHKFSGKCVFLNVKHLYLLKFTEWFRRFFLPIIGFAKNKAGCCLVLRGGTRKELAKVKCVMKQFLLLKTHATFEKAFLLDEPSQVQFIFVNFRFLSFLLNLVITCKIFREIATFTSKISHWTFFFSQVDNFIVPDYKNCHLTQLCLSPFVELPLPDHDLIKGSIDSISLPI